MKDEQNEKDIVRQAITQSIHSNKTELPPVQRSGELIRNEAESDRFLAALLNSRTIYADPDLAVPLPSYLTDLPPNPSVPSRPSHHHKRPDEGRKPAAQSSSSSSRHRPPADRSSAPLLRFPASAESDEDGQTRKVPSLSALSQRLQAELGDDSRSKAARKEEKKKRKDKKDKAEKDKKKKKKSSSESD